MENPLEDGSARAMLAGSDLDSPSCRKAGTKVKFIRTASLPASTARPMPSKKTARMGDKAKPSGRWGTGGFAVKS